MLLVVDGFWENESHFSLLVWLLIGLILRSEYPDIIVQRRTLTESGKLKLINSLKIRKQNIKFCGDLMGLLEGFRHKTNE